MLGKLMKHEFKATYKIFLALYAGLIAMTLLTLITFRLDIFDMNVLSTFRGICSVGLIISLVAIPFVTVIYIAYRFYHNLFTDEGYLMFTLPVKKSSLILSKYMVSIVWLLGTAAAMVLSACILIFGSSNASEIKDMVQAFFNESFKLILGDQSGSLYAIIFYCFTDMLYLVSFIFMALSFGQFILPKHKILGAVLAYFVLQIVQQILSSIVLGVFHVSGKIDFSSGTMPLSFFYVMGVILFALAALWLFLTNVICEKKLNLS